MFIGSAERRLLKPECVSSEIERHSARSHRAVGISFASGLSSLRYSAIASVFAVLDLTAEFYLETVRLVFQEQALPRGLVSWRWPQGRDARDPPHHAADRRRREGRHLRGRPDLGRARSLRNLRSLYATAPPCRPASATTAYSAASIGKTRFIRS
jgi:hypothetical protein